ncbi:hypothetical protein KBY28_20170 [Ruegeria pomeroyi]|uniref:hypothetical protein n=1 Tax=Ruegeria pomeroyi TaxID=89184 RepID=UPI001F1577B3|nr:hypothetical protein [Ruegeria pomeroyi]MCE8510775.1 hypothetical protein [Ruegeria pomeroyi]
MKRLVSAAMCIWSGMVGAAELDGCALSAEDYADLVAPLLDGAWQAHNGPGLMMMKMGANEMKLPMPRAGHEVMAMLYRDGTVYADMAQFGEAEIRLADPDSQIAPVPVDGAQQDLDFATLGLAPDCSTDRMLRLEFDQERIDEEGTHLWLHVHLAVLDEDRMGGVLTVQGRGKDGTETHARRLVSFLRN